jgi:hypothetical protein
VSNFLKLTKECGWKDGDRGGLAEWEQTHGKKKVNYALTSTGLLVEEVRSEGEQATFWPQHHSNPHTARAFAMSVVKSSRLEKTAVIPKASASFSMSTL